jgi:hypothetical protein
MALPQLPIFIFFPCRQLFDKLITMLTNFYFFLLGFLFDFSIREIASSHFATVTTPILLIAAIFATITTAASWLVLYSWTAMQCLHGWPVRSKSMHVHIDGITSYSLLSLVWLLTLEYKENTTKRIGIGSIYLLVGWILYFC